MQEIVQPPMAVPAPSARHPHAARPANRPANATGLLAIATLATLAILAGCGKNERIPTTAERLSSVQQKQATQPDFYVPRKTVDYMGDLKSLKDTPAKQDPPPVAAKAEPARPAVAAAPAPVETRPAAPAPAPVPQQAAAPAPSAPPPNVVASAAPTARPAAPQESPQSVNVLHREQPEFPREAMRSGVESGQVRARVSINAAGEVTNVSILQAQPARVFDRSVQAAMRKWRFNAGADNRSYETEIAFRAAN